MSVTFFFTQIEIYFTYILSDFPKVTELIGDGAEACNQENVTLKPVFLITVWAYYK